MSEFCLLENPCYKKSGEKEHTRSQLPLADDVTDSVDVGGRRVLESVRYDVPFRVNLNT